MDMHLPIYNGHAMVVPHGVCLSEVPLTVVASKNSLLAMHAVCQGFLVAIESC